MMRWSDGAWVRPRKQRLNQLRHSDRHEVERRQQDTGGSDVHRRENEVSAHRSGAANQGETGT